METEKQLIYREDALNAVSSDYLMGSMPEHDLALLQTARRKLKALLTVDAVEVVHGRWKQTGMHLLPYECSVCGSKEEGRTNYCPNCGARMDLEAI